MRSRGIMSLCTLARQISHFQRLNISSCLLVVCLPSNPRMSRDDEHRAFPLSSYLITIGVSPQLIVRLGSISHHESRNRWTKRLSMCVRPSAHAEILLQFPHFVPSLHSETVHRMHYILKLIQICRTEYQGVRERGSGTMMEVTTTLDRSK
jgi:hypothetical protein